ncbi:hypothetical protein WA026_002349 [Henosepilachna vigintioctopunctata]|uniref:Uncharacterized protein n=1 Tax=Henosepilachna vigintioctopunctata TaxID=420089 RepID=A0AAW1TR45_9CUCU
MAYPSLSPCYSLTYEGTHGRMPGIGSSFAATLTQNSNNLGEIRVKDFPIYFKENSESSESIKKLQRNKTPSDSLHYGLALKQHYDRKHLMKLETLKRKNQHSMKPETLKRKKIKSHEQLDAIEKISLNSELTKKFEEFSVNLLGKLSTIDSEEKNDFPCHSSTDSTMHHHISKRSPEKDRKLSQSNSKNGNEILTPDNLNMLLVHEDFFDASLVHEDFFDASLGSPCSLIQKHENSLESDIKIEPIDVITIEDVIKSEDSESENSHHQEGNIEVFPIQDEKNSELHSTEYIKDVNKKRIESIKHKTKHKLTKSKSAKTALSENPKPIKQIFIYNNSENLLNETVDLLESDCESADNSNNQIPERTSEIFSAIQNIYKYSDNLLNETVDAYKSYCENADNSNNQIAETTSKVISSTQNIYNNREAY